MHPTTTPYPDFRDVRGHLATVEAVAAAVARGDRGLLLVGPPGIGRTMVARRIPGLLGPLSDHEQRWLTATYEGARVLPSPADVVSVRPFRAPHHTVSAPALAGDRVRRGGALRHSSERELARFGVLMLDELPEFSAVAIDRLAHGLRHMTGAPFVVGTALPCPCGYHGSDQRTCVCSTAAIARFASRTQRMLATLGLDPYEPLNMGNVTLDQLRASKPGPSTAELRRRHGLLLRDCERCEQPGLGPICTPCEAFTA